MQNIHRAKERVEGNIDFEGYFKFTSLKSKNGLNDRLSNKRDKI